MIPQNCDEIFENVADVGNNFPSLGNYELGGKFVNKNYDESFENLAKIDDNFSSLENEQHELEEKIVNHNYDGIFENVPEIGDNFSTDSEKFVSEEKIILLFAVHC